MASSNTFNFGSIENAELIYRSYGRCGIQREFITADQAQVALVEMNLVLSDLTNRGILQPSTYFGMVQVYPGQAKYFLPRNLINILELMALNTIRNVTDTGVPFSSAGGVAANAFDGDPATACIQTAPNGYISYDYGVGNEYSIPYVGITSNINTTYTLALEYSYDNSTWILGAQEQTVQFYTGKVIWYVLNNIPSARAWRIRETNGSTLNIQELYFNIDNTTRQTTSIGRQNYLTAMNKNQQSSVGSYWLEKAQIPYMAIWPTPNDQIDQFMFSYQGYIEDVGHLQNSSALPQRFLETVVSILSYKLALNYAPDRIGILKDSMIDAYDVASATDNDWATPFVVRPQFIEFTR